VELKQIELRGLQSLKRALQLAGVGRLELGRKEDLVAGCARSEDVADDDLGVAVGRGGIDNSAAAADERRDDVAGLAFSVRVGGVVESGPVPRPTAGRASPLLRIALESSGAAVERRRVAPRGGARAGQRRQVATRHI
jgi:hypothetical protein